MTWVTGVVLYIVIWWVALFAVLPIGARPAQEADPASGWRGAPQRPRILFRIVLTSAVSGVIWIVAYLAITSEYLSFRGGFLALPPG